MLSATAACVHSLLSAHIHEWQALGARALTWMCNLRAGRRSVGTGKSAQKRGKKRRRGRRKSANPFIDAVILEDLAHEATYEEDTDESDAYSDLEDFIVCKPGRNSGDYAALINKHFRYSADEYGASQRTKREPALQGS